MKAADVANAICNQGAVFCRRRWVVVPNVSWGWGLQYEADLIAVSADGWSNEIEIKVNKSDLKNDCKKGKWSSPVLDSRIKRFWYAIPEDLLETALDETVVNKKFGIICVYPAKNQYSFSRARVIRRATNLPSRLTTPEEIKKLLHLGLMRYWDLRLKTSQIESDRAQMALTSVGITDTVEPVEE